MKLAIVGSRSIGSVELDEYITDEVTEIVSGGAGGVDSCAAEYARSRGVKLTEIIPDYKRYGRAAPIVRNKQIVEYADRILVIWDGSSRGSASVIKYAESRGKPCVTVTP